MHDGKELSHDTAEFAFGMISANTCRSETVDKARTQGEYLKELSDTLGGFYEDADLTMAIYTRKVIRCGQSPGAKAAAKKKNADECNNNL